MSKARSILVPILLLGLAAGAMPSLAGTPGYLEPGARVRATVVERDRGRTVLRRIEGTLIAVSDTTIIVRPKSSRAAMVIRQAELDRLQVQVRGSRRGRGALIGLAAGAVIGAAVGYSDGDDPGGLVAFSAEQKAGMGAILLAPVGLLIGALAAPGAQWDTVPGTQLKMGVTACGAGRSGVFLVARF